MSDLQYAGPLQFLKNLVTLFQIIYSETLCYFERRDLSLKKGSVLVNPAKIVKKFPNKFQICHIFLRLGPVPPDPFAALPHTFMHQYSAKQTYWERNLK